jgi:Ni/Fe-hydrogenase 1 B-type cytochrome subunit
MSNKISRVAIFSTAQRISHWLIAAGTLFLLISAWLIQHSDVDALAWIDWHVMVGQGLSLVLAFRVYLLFIGGSGNWRLLVPGREQRHVALQTVKFYASLGRLPCPDWYAFNPIWQPLYLLLYVLLILTTLSGYLIGNYLFPAGLPMPQWHGLLADLVLYFTLAHIPFVILHDVKGNGAHISGMLNGFKYFHTKEVVKPVTENSVSLNSLLKK